MQIKLLYIRICIVHAVFQLIRCPRQAPEVLCRRLKHSKRLVYYNGRSMCTGLLRNTNDPSRSQEALEKSAVSVLQVLIALIWTSKATETGSVRQRNGAQRGGMSYTDSGAGYECIKCRGILRVIGEDGRTFVVTCLDRFSPPPTTTPGI